MIHVHARITLNPGCRAAFLAEFHALMPAVHAEVGCLEYGPAVDATTDLPKQLKLGEDIVLIVEKWESLDALKAHLVAPHMTPYRERVKDMVVGTELFILEPA